MKKKQIILTKENGKVLNKDYNTIWEIDTKCKYAKIELVEGIEHFYCEDFPHVETKELIFPSTLKNLEISEFSIKSESISVHENNPLFCSKDGVLFDKNMSTILLYPCLRESFDYWIPEGVVVIGCDSFGGAKIAKLNIPKSVKVMEWYIFENSAIKTFEVPKHVQVMDGGAFLGSEIEYLGLPMDFCIDESPFELPNSLKVIKYEGSKELWERLVNFYEIQVPQGCRVICDDTVIS